MRQIKSSTDLEAAIRSLIDYNWKDELRDFEEHVHDDDGTHVFRTLVSLDNWVQDSDHTPESYIKDEPATDCNCGEPLPCRHMRADPRRAEIIEDLVGFILPKGDDEKIADALLSGTIRHVKAVEPEEAL